MAWMKAVLIAFMIVTATLVSGVSFAAQGFNDISIAPSGDNLLQATWTDRSGEESAFNWAWKASSSGSQFILAGSDGAPIDDVLDSGNSLIVWPSMAGKRGTRLSLISPSADVMIEDGKQLIRLPTGKIVLSIKDGKVFGIPSRGGCRESRCFELNLPSGGPPNTATFNLERRAGTGVEYTATATSSDTVSLKVEQTFGQPALMLLEGKNSDGERNAVIVRASTQSFGASNLAIAGAPFFTDGTTETVRAGDPSVLDATDSYGTKSVRSTAGQDTVTLSYPKRKK